MNDVRFGNLSNVERKYIQNIVHEAENGHFGIYQKFQAHEFCSELYTTLLFMTIDFTLCCSLQNEN